jgi:hypothetical protein
MTIARDNQVVRFSAPAENKQTKVTLTPYSDANAGNALIYDDDTFSWRNKRDVEFVIHPFPLEAWSTYADIRGWWTGAPKVHYKLNAFASGERIGFRNDTRRQILISLLDTSSNIVLNEYVNPALNENDIYWVQSDIVASADYGYIEFVVQRGDNSHTGILKTIGGSHDGHYHIEPDESVKLICDVKDPARIFAGAVITGAVVGTQFIGLEELVGLLRGTQVPREISLLAKYLGKPIGPLIRGYAAAFGAVLSEGYYGLDDFLDIRLHGRALRAASKNLPAILAAMANIVNNNPDLEDILGAGAAGGFALGIFAFLATHERHYYMNATEFYDYATHALRSPQIKDQSWSVNLKQQICYTTDTPATLYKNLSNDTITSGDQKYKADIIVRSIHGSQMKKTTGLESEVSLLTPERSMIFDNEVATITTFNDYVVMGTFDEDTTPSVNGVILRNIADYPIMVQLQCDTTAFDTATSLASTNFVGPGSSLLIPYELIREVKSFIARLWDASSQLIGKNAIAYAAGKTFRIARPGALEIEYDFHSGLTALTAGLGSAALEVLGTPIASVLRGLSKYIKGPFKKIAQIVGKPVSQLMFGYAAAWGTAIYGGVQDLGDLLNPTLHQEIIASLPRDKTFLLSLAASAGSSVMGGWLGKTVGVGAQIGLGMAMYSSVAIRRRWQRWT